MLLFGFDVFPTFGTLLSLESEECKLGIVSNVSVVQRMLALHAPLLLAHCRHLLLCHWALPWLSHVLLLRGHLCHMGLMGRELVSHGEGKNRCECQIELDLST